MPKKSKPKTINIQDQIMSLVTENKITMKPRWYFVAGSVLGVLGLVGTGLVTVFLLNLCFFLLRTHGPNGQYRLAQILDSMPLWIPVLSIVSLSLGIHLLKMYDFSYKKNFYSIVLAILASILFTAFLLDFTKINTRWANKPQIRRLYQQKINKGNTENWQRPGRQNLERFNPQ
jgi:hypothetical protein